MTANDPKRAFRATRLPMRMVSLLLAFGLIGQQAVAEDAAWYFRDGRPIPDSDSRKGANGFGASLVVTPDEDWQAKWNTPHENVPHFRSTEKVRRGGKITILIFFLNPQLDSKGEVNVRCDIKMIRPNGTVSIDETNAVCMSGKLQGDPRSVRLAMPVLVFVGEPQDPLGEWRLEVSVKDVLRKTALPLKAKFSLLP